MTFNQEIDMTADAPPEAQAAANAEAQQHAGAAPPTPAPSPPPKPTAPAEAYDPVLSEPVVYRDAHGIEHAALVTRVIDDSTVHLVIFPDQGHHHHVTASAIAEDSVGPGWYPTDA